MQDSNFERDIEETEPNIVIAPKKGRLWPPILVLCILFTAGLFLFLFIKTPTVPVTDPDIPWFSLKDGILSFEQTKYTGSEELTVPSSIRGQAVTTISDDCFRGCTGIITVHLPEGITAIGSGAFAECTDLRGIKLPETLTTINDNAFSGCTKLEAVCIPYSVKKAGSSLFSGCGKIEYIFYAGPSESWKELRIKFSTKVYIYCHDGLYLQE